MTHHASATLTVDGRPVTVHAFRTGTVTVRRSHRSCCLPEPTPYPVRFAAIVADPRWAEPMPIWAFAVDHPDGLVLVDAGADPSFDDPQSWRADPVGRRLVRRFLRIDVTEEQTLPAQLRAAGLDPAAAQALVLTHQHLDHTATVPAFPGADVWTTRAEDRAARAIGSLPWRWRDAGTRLRYVDEEGRPGELGRSVDLVADGSLRASHTPGHTPGSVSVVLRADQTEVWFTGDTSFTAEAMAPRAPTAGIHTDLAQVRRLQARLRGRGLLLPSHDEGNADRLRSARSWPGGAAGGDS